MISIYIVTKLVLFSGMEPNNRFVWKSAFWKLTSQHVCADFLYARAHKIYLKSEANALTLNTPLVSLQTCLTVVCLRQP